MDAKRINLFENIATLVTPIRLILGWQFLSACLRRMVNAPEKLDPNSPAYMGHAFNHFLPHSLFIKPLIKYLVKHQELFYFFIISFIIIEGLVGVSLLLGFFTRIGALGATLLSLGILLGSGWLCSTCVDEWQISIAGIGTGLVILSIGAGIFSLDRLFFKNTQSKILKCITSGEFNLNEKQIKILGFSFSFIAMLITLFTYQIFHGGLHGKLFNLSKKPKIEILNSSLEKDGKLTLTLYRTDGPDTYGAFITKIKLFNNNKLVEAFNPNRDNLPQDQISNYYFNKVFPNNDSLVVPLGSKAKISFQPPASKDLKNGQYKVEIIDVSGLKWTKTVKVN